MSSWCQGNFDGRNACYFIFHGNVQDCCTFLSPNVSSSCDFRMAASAVSLTSSYACWTVRETRPPHVIVKQMPFSTKVFHSKQMVSLKKTGLNELVASRHIWFLLNVRAKTDLPSRVIVGQICESKMGIGKKQGVDFK